MQMTQMSRMTQMPGGACELKNKVVAGLGMALMAAPAFAQEHAPTAEHAPAHATSLVDMLVALAWPVANFAIFCWVIYYFGNQAFTTYLADRSSSIRKDLVEAAELRANANAQLAAIDQKLKALPGGIDALRKRGADEIVAEEQRIARAAAAERDRLLEQTRREIDLQVRLAKREILEHAADLSVQLATERIKKEATPEDQARMVDRYLEQIRKEKV